MHVKLCLHHCVVCFFFFFFSVFLFIYVAAPGFSCSTRNLRSLLQHVKSLVSACKFLVAAWGTYFPNQAPCTGSVNHQASCLDSVNCAVVYKKEDAKTENILLPKMLAISAETSVSRSNNKDHWLQVTITDIITMKAWNSARITKIRHRDTKWADAVGTVVLIGLFEAGLPQTFTL